ncbi:pentatricopeptide repeat-containing protein At4g22760-like [Coffea arabica]|uniref:Pentatricopeptide repeat-containing protein At4g22760-like n=1 Tax=Coffea arabica TaxID=13443 RepID=A0A6P6U3J4_COFAR|nr:pentatricopeptide repeat-containing protein At4g22760-like [Coffea arabica]XP_027085175.1 pentatricopeptide repeat-containing protein At4g22760-like [Coffea arabica]XP_027085176.1 pentatricopeptide repeat-containing protein At4g22760-like [Coffea arabica]
MQIPNFSALLKLSLRIKLLKQIHGSILVNGLDHLEPILIRQIIVSSGSFHQTHVTQYVKTILNHTQHRDVSPLGYAIRFLCQHGQFQDAVIFYVQLQRSGVFPNTYALSSIPKAYGKINCKNGGISVHCQVHKYGFASIVYVQTALLDFYSKMGDIKTAHKVFDEMSDRNIVSWNAIISGYVKFGELEMAQSVFDRMPERDIVSWNAILLGYAKAGKMDQAYVLFKEMPERGASSWNVMIRGYIDRGNIELARGFFDAMPKRNSISYITMISAYSKCGDVESAEKIFYEEEKKDQLLYNAMVACYAQNGRPKEALHLFDEMLQPILNIQPDKMTLASAISACSQLGDSNMGSRIESYMGEFGIRMDNYLSTALIDMHAKCGSIDKAIELFHRLEKKDIVAYSAIILGCGINGRGQDAIKLFEEMIGSNISPNSATITGILSAYNHAGLVEEGYDCFELMQKYGIIPCVDHYAIMVDLLGKAGRLEEAYELIKKMPMQPHSGVWGALLLACSVHNNVELGEIAAAKCFKLEPNSTGYCSLLSKIYVSSGKWDEAKRLREAIEERGFNKVPGCSWIKPAEA